MAVIFLRTVILYALVIFTIRMMGKRQIGELQPSELVITILISNIATMAVEDVSVPLILGIIPIIGFMSLEILSSEISLKSKFFRGLVSGSPKIVIENGVINQKVLKSLRYSAEDLLEQLRMKDIFDLSEVHFAIVETGGTLSVLRKKAEEPPTRRDMNISLPDSPVPILIISSGDILEDNLRAAGISENKVISHLTGCGIARENVFLMTYRKPDIYNIVLKEERK